MEALFPYVRQNVSRFSGQIVTGSLGYRQTKKTSVCSPRLDRPGLSEVSILNMKDFLQSVWKKILGEFVIRALKLRFKIFI